VKPAELTALEAKIASWKAANEAQAQAQNTATTTHATADKAFPYDDKANTAIRREFGLPKNDPYSAV
jgi:hypothetical protein